MKISLITVTYNSAATIRDTLECIQQQSYSDIEYIIVDGASNDLTLSIIAEYSCVTKVLSEPDYGIYDAMNKGIKLASGEVVGILNSDDIYDTPFIIEMVMKTFEDKNVDAVYGNLSYFKTETPTKVVRFWKSLEFSKSFFEDGYVIPHPTLFLRKKVYDNIGLYYPDFKISSDYELMLRAFKTQNFKPYFLDKTLVKMRVGGRSTKNIQNIILGNIEIYKSWKMNGLNVPFLLFYKRMIFKIKQLRKL